MKFSRDGLILLVLALALLAAMLVTLWAGGNRSRHGYGYVPHSASGSTSAYFNHKNTNVPTLKS